VSNLSQNRPAARFCSQCGLKFDAAAALPTPDLPAALQAAPPLDEGVRKHVTVMFADVRGSSGKIVALDPETAMQHLDPAVKAMIAAVGRAGGVVNRMEGDGIMALFGAPIASEDHAIQACLAARAMLESMTQIDPALSIRVGLASGHVVIRQTGQDASDWDAVGITPHLARRMEQRAALGMVLLTASTARLVRGFADLAPLAPVEVRGIDQPVEAFELLAVAARPSWEVRAAAHTLNRFVGRDAELAQLTAAAARVSFGRGQIITVMGDPGIGKSRLLHEFLRCVASGTYHVLHVAAVSHTAGAAYHLAADLLRAWLGVEISDDRATVARKLGYAIALHGHDIDAVPLRALLDLPVDDPDWQALDQPGRRARVLAAFRLAILREAALRPLLIAVEDFHWADPPSAELLEAIVDGLGAARLLVIVTMRGNRPGETRPRLWSTRSYSTEIHLNPLEPLHAEVLINELLGSSETLADLRRQIVAQADGTPLFLEEIARSLTERGALGSEMLRTSLAAEVEIPVSIQGVMAERLDRLPPERCRLLQLASVIGKDLPLALLQKVSDLPEGRLRSELSALQEAEFIYELNLPSGTEYTFKHTLTHAVAYEGMLRRRRRQIHARVLTAIESLYSDRLDEMVERLAEHAFKGEAWELAFTYALRAGRRASGRWAWREAVSLLDQAAEALRHLPETSRTTDQAIEVRLDLRVALAAIGDFPRIAQCLEEARRLAEPARSELRLTQIDTSRCIGFSLLGRLDQAIAAGRQAFETAPWLNDSSAVLNAAFALGQAYWYRGDLREAETVLVQALPYVRGELRLTRSGTTGTASVLHLVCLSKTYALGGDFESAAALAAEAIAIADETRRPYDLAYSRVAEGFHHFMRDDHDAAVAALERGLEFSRSAGIALLVPSVARYLGRSYALVGRRDHAHALLVEAIEQSTAHGLVAFRAWCEAALAHTYLPDVSKAIEAFTDALELARGHLYRPVEVYAMRMLGVLQSRGPEQDRDRAQDWLTRSMELAEKLGLRPQLAEAQRDLAELLDAELAVDGRLHR
jgi:class 3 adenylate cyclase